MRESDRPRTRPLHAVWQERVGVRSGARTGGAGVGRVSRVRGGIRRSGARGHMIATLPSRIKGPQKILKQLRTLQHRAYVLKERNDLAINRCDTPDEQRWCARTGD